jgi:hypothetical protein
MIHKKICAKTLVYILFCIYDAIIFCEMPGDDKNIRLPWKKISLFFILSLQIKITQAVKINKITRFYALKCALLTFCNAFFSKKRRSNG